MVEGKEQEADYEFFRAGVDGRKEGQQATDKRPGEPCSHLKNIELL